MLIFSRAPLFLWAEAIATACFTQNRSIIHRRFNKTPYELINGRKPDISFLHVFGALCYPKNDREDIGKLGAKGDIGFFIGYSADSCAYRIYNPKFVGDFKSLENKADASLAKHKALELEIGRLLKAVVSDQKDNTQDTSSNTKFAKQPIVENLPKVGKTNALSNPVTSNSVSTPQESKSVNIDKVIAPGIFRINPSKTSREEKHVPNTKQMTKVSVKEIQKKYQPKVTKPKKVGTHESLATPKPRKPRLLLRWSPTGMMFDHEGKLAASSNSESRYDCSNGCSKHMIGNLKLLINFVWKFMGTVHFKNDHVAVILGFGNLQWGNILITRVYFVDGLGHNLFSVGQFCDSDLEVAFRRNACFVKNLEGVDLLNRDRSTNLYTINLNEMASASPICLMARASSTKSWLWHQRLSYLNFDTINDLARNDLVSGFPKFKYHKEHLCPSCEQGKSKRASHPPKPVPNSRQRLHLLHMDLCGPMRIASINGKRYVLVIVDDYSRYTWVQFLRSKDEATEVIIKFLKRITVLLQSPVIIIRTDNGTEFKNQVLKEYFDNKIMETMNVSFDELSAMAFEQHSSKPGLQSMTSGHISSGLDLTYAPSTITTQQPSEGELDLLFEAMYDDYIGGQPSATARIVSRAQELQVRQTSTASTTIAYTAPIPTNSSSHATNVPITSQDVNELNPYDMVDGNTFVNPFANSSTSAAASSSSQ
nr:retrovirus-related Pol polyprotein from transposon TNT 1-94 [Tanacetum cinerariifolium]